MKTILLVLSFITLGSINLTAQCNYRLELLDTFGDGWNGGSVTVLVNDSPVLYDLTISSGGGPISHTLSVNPGDNISVEYTAGFFPYENVIYIYDSENIVIYEDGVSGAPIGGVAGTATCPSCFAPSDITVSNLGITNADISWSDNNTGTVFNAEYGTEGFTLGEGTQLTDLSSTSVNLTGLDELTTYEFYISSDCAASSDGQSKTQKVKFTTLPSCWAPTINEVNSITTTTANVTWTENGTATLWDIEVVEESSAFSGTPTASDIATTVLALDNLTAYTNYKFRVRANCGGGDYSIWSNEKMFTTLPTCLIPSGFELSNYTIEGVDIAWTENGSATQWDIEVVIEGNAFTGTPTMADINTTSSTINGLDSYTNYEISIRSNCGGGDLSPWSSPISFTTLPTCTKPSIGPASDITFESAVLTWTENGTAAEWDVEILQTGTPYTGVPTKSGITETSYTMNGLLPYTQYKVRVRSNCGGGDLSPWSNDRYFVTLPTCIIPSDIVYNNLTTAGVEISWTENGSATQWDIEIAKNGSFTGVPTTAEHPSLTYSASGLDIYTEYGVRVRSNCNGDTSPWTSASYFTTLPTCLVTSDVIFNNTTSEAVDITWTENGSATEWDIELVIKGSSFTGTPTITGHSSTTYSPTGLTPNTEYEISIRSNCSGGDLSPWSPASQFSTLPTCLIPSNIGFSNTTTLSTDIDWIENGTATEWDVEIIESGNEFTGTPTASGLTNTTYAASSLMSYTEYAVRVRANCGGGDLSPWSVEKHFITQPLCAIPTIGSAFNITSETAEITWTENGTATQWDVEIVESKDSFTGTPTQSGLATNASSFSGLITYTEYSVRVRSHCDGGGFSPWSSAESFIPIPTCVSPTLNKVNVVTGETADISWTENGSATEWDIIILSAGALISDTPIESASGLSMASFNASSLTSGMAYDVYVRSNCGGGDLSAWSMKETFVTAMSAVTNPSPCNFGYTIVSNACTTIPITVTDNGILGTDLTLEEVRFIANHTFTGDLEISLTSPANITVDLSSNNGGNGDNYGVGGGDCSSYTAFNMTGANGLITSGSAPFTGAYIPEGDLENFDDLTTNAQGDWVLKICDYVGGDNGTVQFVELVFESLIPTDIDELGMNKSNLFVFPNPASTELSVRQNLSLKENNVLISLLAVNGEKVYSKRISSATVLNEEINVSKLSAGIYILKVQVGNKVTTQKVIITK